MIILNQDHVETEVPCLRNALASARAGDPEAYGEVYRACAGRLLRQAMLLCGNLALAEDLAQDTLVEAWKSLRRYNGRCEFFTWLCALLLHRHHNSFRRRRPIAVSLLGNSQHVEFANAVANLPDRSSLPDQAAELQEQAAVIRKCLEMLPAKHQQVIYLRFYVDDSLDGIAAALGCSVGTVKSRLFHALEKLRGMAALRAEIVHLKSSS